MTGVPKRSAMSVNATPAMDTTPSAPRAALRGHTWAGRPLKAAAPAAAVAAVVAGLDSVMRYILSGAVTPSRPSALASVWRVASARPRRAACSGTAFSPAFGRIWQAS